MFVMVDNFSRMHLRSPEWAARDEKTTDRHGCSTSRPNGPNVTAVESEEFQGQPSQTVLVSGQ